MLCKVCYCTSFESRTHRATCAFSQCDTRGRYRKIYRYYRISSRNWLFTFPYNIKLWKWKKLVSHFQLMICRSRAESYPRVHRTDRASSLHTHIAPETLSLYSSGNLSHKYIVTDLINAFARQQLGKHIPTCNNGSCVSVENVIARC
jgi:hypothetical protein